MSTAAAVAGPAQFVIVNINAAGVGFNDPTPAAPVGGNTGTTLGEQRLIAFSYAASLWSARLDSNVPIRIRAQFTSLAAGVLGSAGPIQVFRDFPNAPLAQTLVPRRAGQQARRRRSLARHRRHQRQLQHATSTSISGWTTTHGALNDLVAVLLHEFAHGLGFSQTASLTTGAYLAGFPDHYNSKLLDTVLGLHWNADDQRAAPRVGDALGQAWCGTASVVTAGLPFVLSLGSPTVDVNSPASIAGIYQFGTASFGPRVGSPSVTANVVAAVDAVEAAVVGATTTDGCSPFDNAAAVAGQIALIERGQCGFAVKARNASRRRRRRGDHLQQRGQRERRRRRTWPTTASTARS